MGKYTFENETSEGQNVTVKPVVGYELMLSCFCFVAKLVQMFFYVCVAVTVDRKRQMDETFSNNIDYAWITRGIYLVTEQCVKHGTL